MEILEENGLGVKLFTMQNTEFYRQILGIDSPWKIVSVDLDVEAKRVVICVEVDANTKWFHPDSKLPASLHKGQERTWRYLDTCQFETFIKANVPIVMHENGSIEEIAVPCLNEKPPDFTKSHFTKSQKILFLIKLSFHLVFVTIFVCLQFKMAVAALMFYKLAYHIHLGFFTVNIVALVFGWFGMLAYMRLIRK